VEVAPLATKSSPPAEVVTVGPPFSPHATLAAASASAAILGIHVRFIGLSSGLNG
jgi:hypothetical protein